MIGPSLTDSTRMSAPNTPRSTRAPSRSSSAHTASYAGSLTGPGAAVEHRFSFRSPILNGDGNPAQKIVAAQREHIQVAKRQQQTLERIEAIIGDDAVVEIM